MPWCTCEVPTLREGKLKLRKDDKCLRCGNTIRKYYATKNGRFQEVGIAETFHECQSCHSSIERGDIYVRMPVEVWERGRTWDTWDLCWSCFRKNHQA